MRRAGMAALALILAMAASCGGNGGTPSASPTAPAGTGLPTQTPGGSPSRTATAVPETPEASVHPGPPAEPLGFPIDPETRLGLVTGTVGAREIEWGAGPEARTYARDFQPAADADEANRSGWNCRVHVEYEGRPAVDWYIPTGTPVFATMEGTATLYAITTANGFDYYGISREPYLGNPDRSRAGMNPFPGPGGGTGVYVEIDSGLFLTVSAHLDLSATAEALPERSFYAGYSAETDFEALFSGMAAGGGTPIAQWQVRRGDLIGYSGDAGYSEAPHLHYTVQRSGANTLLCPTEEAGFEDGGWLLK